MKILNYRIIFALILSLCLFSGCEDEEKEAHEPKVREEAGEQVSGEEVQAGEAMAGEMTAGDMAGEEVQVDADMGMTSGVEASILDMSMTAGDEVECQAIPVCEEGTIEVVDCQDSEDPNDCEIIEVCDTVIFCQEAAAEELPESDSDSQ